MSHERNRGRPLTDEAVAERRTRFPTDLSSSGCEGYIGGRWLFRVRPPRTVDDIVPRLYYSLASKELRSSDIANKLHSKPFVWRILGRDDSRVPSSSRSPTEPDLSPPGGVTVRSRAEEGRCCSSLSSDTLPSDDRRPSPNLGCCSSRPGGGSSATSSSGPPSSRPTRSRGTPGSSSQGTKVSPRPFLPRSVSTSFFFLSVSPRH